MNKKFYSESIQSMDLNLEVRLLTMLAGEASDFERDQLKQLIEQREDVAKTYARLRELHGCLVEVGTGELASSEGEWKLPAARRERLLSVLGGEVALADGDAQPILVAVKEKAKWTTLRLSKSFVAVASLLLVVGLAWGLSLPAVQMARKSARRLAESTAMQPDSAAGVSSEMSGGASMNFARETEAPTDAKRFRYFAEGDFKAPSVVLDKAKSQLQETLQAGLPEPRYLEDGVQYLPAEVAGQAANGSFFRHGVAGGYGGSGGERGAVEFEDAMVAVEEADVPYGVFGGLANPSLPAADNLASAGQANGSVLSVVVPDAGRTLLGGVPELPALGIQVPSEPASEPLSRSESLSTPRIIVTDEKADALPDAEAESLFFEQKSASQSENEQREYSFGIPFTSRGGGTFAERGQNPARQAAEVGDDNNDFDFQPRNFQPRNLGRTAQIEASGRYDKDAADQPMAGYLKMGKAVEGWELAERLLGEQEESRLARRGVELRQATPVGIEELSAATEAFSTFSLHVSDVSFKLAAAALSQGEWPDASKIRIEEFVNAFDYRDPLPTQAEKVSCRMEQAIHPFLMQRNLLRVSMRTAATGRSGGTPLRLTLLLDNSGSMERNDRRQALLRAFEALIQQLTPADQITLISFANRPRLLADRITGDQASQLLQIIETLPSEGGTNIEAALQLAMEKANEQRDLSAQHRIVLLTDGAVNLGNANPDNLSAMVTEIRDRGIAFDAAGISAQDLNDEVLEALARQGDGRYYLLDSAESVSDGFADQIAGALRPSAKNVKVQIEFNPQRVGQYKLLGFEKHRLQKEDFRNDQVDAAEMTAAEAGVAIYQFEARPDGVGDVGTASVRFRDLTTGQMVERTWPIPYESHPPRIEEANPSLRIAAAAALFAAKLKTEPLGASVSLKALASWLAELPAADRNTPRVQQLQSMFEQARQIRGSEE